MMPMDTRQTVNTFASDLITLAPLAARLNVATDELNHALQTIQDQLNAMSLGVEVWIPQALRTSG
jgi:hypothetical protein